MSKYLKGLNKPCIEMFMGTKVVNMKVVIEPLRNYIIRNSEQ